MNQEHLFPEDREFQRLKEKSNSARLALLEEMETAKSVLTYFQRFLPYAPCLFEKPYLVLDNIKFAAEHAEQLSVALARAEKAAESFAYSMDELHQLYEAGSKESSDNAI